MIALNIRQPWLGLILDGRKTIETRNHTRFQQFLEQEVALCEVGSGLILGYATITQMKEYDTKSEFQKDKKKHFVYAGSEYSFVDGKTKYGYVLSNVRYVAPHKPTVVKEMRSHKIIL